MNPKVCVVGLGYVGLPTCIAFHDAGFSVCGIDVDQGVIETLKGGKSHLVDEVEDLEVPISSSDWNVTSDFSEGIPHSDVILICVPTPTNASRLPDLSYVEGALESVVRELTPRKKPVIVLESTVYPGVTNQLTTEALQKHPEKKEMFEIAYSPERISPGDIGKSASDVSRIVGSNNVQIGEMLARIYSKVTKGGCTYVGSIEVAEAAKMVENTQRDIDIAFVNELAKVLPKLGIDVEEVLDAASTKWNFHRHNPGIGVGGHCIPVDPYYYIKFSEDVGQASLISPAARRINESMPSHAKDIIISKMPEKSSVLVLGMSYKPNVGDIRETPVKPLLKSLIDSRFEVYIYDPYLDKNEFKQTRAKALPSLVDLPPKIDGVILATAHQKFLDLDWADLRDRISGNFLFDGPRKLSPGVMKSYGWEYSGIGFPL